METDILSQQSTKKVYNTNSFTVATILGGPLAAAYLASSNYNSFGESKKSRFTWIAAIFLLLASMATTFVPELEKIPNFFYVLFFVLIVQVLVHRFQAKKIRQHIEEGGQLYPFSRAIVIGIIFMVALVVVIFGLAYLLDNFVVKQ